MITMGIRAAPSSVTFAIYDSVADEVVTVDRIVVPASFETPDMLKYVRSHLLDVIREYAVEIAVIKATEPSSPRISIERVEIEGVIQESFASSMLLSYYKSFQTTVMSRLGRPVGDFRKFVTAEIDPGVENWGALTAEAREAFLCAKGAPNA